MEVVGDPVDEDELSSEPSVLYLLEEGIVEPRYVGSRPIFNSSFTAIRISGLMTKHNVELY